MTDKEKNDLIEQTVRNTKKVCSESELSDKDGLLSYMVSCLNFISQICEFKGETK